MNEGPPPRSRAARKEPPPPEGQSELSPRTRRNRRHRGVFLVAHLGFAAAAPAALVAGWWGENRGFASKAPDLRWLLLGDGPAGRYRQGGRTGVLQVLLPERPHLRAHFRPDRADVRGRTVPSGRNAATTASCSWPSGWPATSRWIASG